MFDERSQVSLESRVVDGRLAPDYGGFCLSEVPGAVRYLLNLQEDSPFADLMAAAGVTPRGTEKVVVFLVDGFGYRHWRQYSLQHAFLHRIERWGMVGAATSVWPSTTAAALTTMHTDLTPQEHGLPEWMTYERELGRNIHTLPFAEIDTGASLIGRVDPALLFDGRTFYERLADAGIPSYTFTDASIAHTAYAKQLTRGSIPVPYLSASDLAVNLRQHLERSASEAAYYYVYWPVFDKISHRYGPRSPQHLAEMDSFFHVLEAQLMNGLTHEKAQGVSVLVTADHGQIAIRPEETVFLDDFPELVQLFGRTNNNRLILPWGSARDCFLAVRDGRIGEAHRFLKDALGDRATILRSEDALRQGLFGRGQSHPRLRDRIGDLLILPHHGRTVWYRHDPNKTKFSKNGVHGGMSLEEMMIPLGCVRMVDLVG